MARETSKASYDIIRASGYLGNKQQDVYECLYHYGPLTDSELAEKLDRPRDWVGPRIRELLVKGVIKEDGARSCRITRRMCRITDVTANLPRQVAPKEKRNLSHKGLAEEATKIAGWLGQLRVAYMAPETLAQYRLAKTRIAAIRQALGLAPIAGL